MSVHEQASSAIAGAAPEATAMNVLVALALLFALGFALAWARSPRLRAWIEKPSRRFQEHAQGYDRMLALHNRRGRGLS